MVLKTVVLGVFILFLPFSTQEDDVCTDTGIRLTVAGVLFESCSTLINKWPYLCDSSLPYQVAQYCCASCRGKDISCVDKPVSLGDDEDENLSCEDIEEYGLEWHCKTPAIRENCCATCSNLDLECIDNVNAKWVYPSGEKKGCAEAAQDTGQCRFCEENRDQCCETCSQYTKEYCELEGCVKDDDAWSVMHMGRRLTCTDLEDEFACLCSVEAYRLHCCKACAKIIFENECRDCNTWTLTVYNKPYTDCSLMDEHPFFCSNPVFFNRRKKSGYCCKKCAEIRRNDYRLVRCSDNPMKAFRSALSPNPVYCPELVALNPCMCDIPVVKENCCRTCRETDYSHCGCKDRLKSDFTEVVLGKEFNSCRMLMRPYMGYPGVCLQEKFSKEGGLCCESCSKEDLTCIDEASLISPFDGAPPSECKDLAKQWPYFCKYTSEEMEGGIKDRCCKSCQHSYKLTKYADNPIFVGSVEGPKGCSCVDCTCEDLTNKAKSGCRSLLYKACGCANEDNPFSHNCQKLCRRLPCFIAKLNGEGSDTAGESSDTGNGESDTGSAGSDTASAGSDTGSTGSDTGSAGSDTGSEGSDTVSEGSDTGSTGSDTGSEGSDTGSEGSDNGSAGSDTGSEGPDTGSEGSDTGSAGSDTGSEESDTGSEGSNTDNERSDTGSAGSDTGNEGTDTGSAGSDTDNEGSDTADEEPDTGSEGSDTADEEPDIPPFPFFK